MVLLFVWDVFENKMTIVFEVKMSKNHKTSFTNIAKEVQKVKKAFATMKIDQKSYKIS